MMPSRSTLASTLAAATDEHVRSALVRVTTAGPATPCSPNSPLRRGSVSQSWLPSSSTTSTSTPAAASARRPAIRSAAMMPWASISSGPACPTPRATPHRDSCGTRPSRRAAERSLESRTPTGAVPTAASTTTTPTLTGPASAPRPTSSMPATRRAP
ncbi:hypothetical protein BJF82_00180 [Kytococcus sp. CUA-901]|nr:hypothetical protein BJF82_00180 [Kytococcus sp. CUA-901]